MQPPLGLVQGRPLCYELPRSTVQHLAGASPWSIASRLWTA